MDDKSKPGFMVYHDKFAMIDRLPDAQFHQFMRAVYQYSLDGSAVEFDDPALSVVFAMWQQLIDADTERYNRRREAARNAVNSRWERNNADTDVYGRIRTHTDAYEAIPTDTNGYEAIRSDTKNTNYQQSTINNQQSTINDKEESTVRKRTTHARAQIPTIDEVRAYIAEKGYDIDPEYFVDYYSARGWKTKQGPVVDWKACVRTWVHKDKERRADNNDGNGSGTSEDAQKRWGNLSGIRVI